jgi:hypothetical protein
MTSHDRNDVPERRAYQPDDVTDRASLPTGAEDEDFARGQRDMPQPETGDRGDYARSLDAGTTPDDPDYARGQRDFERPEDQIGDAPRGDFARGQRDDETLSDTDTLRDRDV